MVEDLVQRTNNFLLTIKKAVNLIFKHIKQDNFIRIVSHFDADGLAAAGILGKMLVRTDAYFSIGIEKQIDELK